MLLVRHARPVPVPGRSPALWELAPGADAECEALAWALPGGLGPFILSSPEIKAQQTAAVLGFCLGLEVEVDAGLREVGRPEGWVEDYDRAAAAYLAGSPAEGWEAVDAVSARMREVAEALIEVADEGVPVAVGHGLAITALVASVMGIEPVAFWRGLRMPDAWLLDLGAGAVMRAAGRAR